MGRPVQFNKDKDMICLTTDKAMYTFKKVQKESWNYVGTIKQEIEEDKIRKEKWYRGGKSLSDHEYKGFCKNQCHF